MPGLDRARRPVDRERLLGFLAEREGTTRSPLVQAVYAGLRERILHGDFDRTEP